MSFRRNVPFADSQEIQDAPRAPSSVRIDIVTNGNDGRHVEGCINQDFPVPFADNFVGRWAHLLGPSHFSFVIW